MNFLLGLGWVNKLPPINVVYIFILSSYLTIYFMLVVGNGLSLAFEKRGWITESEISEVAEETGNAFSDVNIIIRDLVRDIWSDKDISTNDDKSKALGMIALLTVFSGLVGFLMFFLYQIFFL